MSTSPIAGTYDLIVKAPLSGSAEVNFGLLTSGQEGNAEVTVSNTAVTSGQIILCSPAAVATADHDPEDAMLEGLTAYAGNIVDGVGFTIYVRAPQGTFGRYQINYLGG